MKVEAEFLKSESAAKVFDAFAAAGFNLWFVGGCVRNAIQQVPADDLDLSTDATPDEMRQIAKDFDLKIVPTGEAHGTMTFVSNGVSFETTTFRKDVQTDGRRAVVAFSKDMSDDAVRRDFTMNALYLDRTGTLFDPVGGYHDAVQKRVRFINNAT